MPAVYRPTLADIEQAFTEGTAPFCGNIWDRSSAGESLFIRSVYPQIREVVAGDQFQRGVALRVVEDSICIYPYLFRQTGQNGAILAWAISSPQAQRIRSRGTAAQCAQVLAEVRYLVFACSDDMILQNAIQHSRFSTEVEANVVQRLMPLLSSLPQNRVGDVLDRITMRFESQRNRTLYELMNAVAAVARETASPSTRWRLEELAGSLIGSRAPASSRTRRMAPPRPKRRAASAARR